MCAEYHYTECRGAENYVSDNFLFFQEDVAIECCQQCLQARYLTFREFLPLSLNIFIHACSYHLCICSITGTNIKKQGPYSQHFVF
jgi:hypothetical protein